MRILLYISFLFVSTLSYGQDVNGCDGQRYSSFLFEEVTVTPDLQFGQAITFAGAEQDLFLDVYEPSGDDLENRPVVVLAFGGSFIQGSRKDIDWLCEGYAQMGYVAVSIDYRIFDGPLFPIPNAAVMQQVVIKALGDMKAAVRYLREDADNENRFKINPDQIIVGGISAGGIVASHVAALDSTDVIDDVLRDIVAENGGFEGNASDNKQYSSEVQGLINFSGGLSDAGFLDENDPPIFSIHDDMDGVVPYAGGFAEIFGIPIIFMEGSKRLQERADSLGITNELITIEDSDGHVSYLFSNDDQTAEMVRRSAVFLNDEILCPSFLSSVEQLNNRELNLSPNPTSGIVSLSESVTKIDVYNNMGQMVKSLSNTHQVDLGMMTNGLYYIFSTTNDGFVNTQKVVLRK